jgi:V-type H+-transporting ATPase subunit E
MVRNGLSLNDLSLTSGSAGGILVVGGGGRIDIDNTLEQRLKLLEVDALPMVRASLFGKNDNRRFVD